MTSGFGLGPFGTEPFGVGDPTSLVVTDFSGTGSEASNPFSLQVYDVSFSGAADTSPTALQVLSFTMGGTSNQLGVAPMYLWDGVGFIPLDLYVWNGTAAVPINDLVYAPIS